MSKTGKPPVHPKVFLYDLIEALYQLGSPTPRTHERQVQEVRDPEDCTPGSKKAKVHALALSGYQRQCAHCKAHRSRYRCPLCDVNLCVTCAFEYHEDNRLTRF